MSWTWKSQQETRSEDESRKEFREGLARIDRALDLVAMITTQNRLARGY